MAEPLATVEDVESLWRSLSPSEKTVAAARLAAVSAWVRLKVPTVDARLASGVLDADVVRLIVVDAVRRVMDGPADGVRSRTQTVGPFSESVTYTDGGGSAGAWLTAAELDMLRGPEGSSAKRAGVGSFRVRLC